MRVKFQAEKYQISEPGVIDIWVEDFPFRPMVGDLIDEKAMGINETKFTDTEIDMIYSYGWSIEYICWEADEKGIYLKAFIVGE